MVNRQKEVVHYQNRRLNLILFALVLLKLFHSLLKCFITEFEDSLQKRKERKTTPSFPHTAFHIKGFITGIIQSQNVGFFEKVLSF